jgi:hypothetical protein
MSYYEISGNFPHIRAKLSGNVALTTSANVTIPFNTISIGTGLSGNVYTAPVTGLYYFTTTLSFFCNSGTSDPLQWGYKYGPSNNIIYMGDDVNQFTTSTSYWYNSNFSLNLKLNQGETVSLVYTGFSNASPVSIIADGSYFHGFLVSRF